MLGRTHLRAPVPGGRRTDGRTPGFVGSWRSLRPPKQRRREGGSGCTVPSPLEMDPKGSLCKTLPFLSASDAQYRLFSKPSNAIPSLQSPPPGACPLPWDQSILPARETTQEPVNPHRGTWQTPTPEAGREDFSFVAAEPALEAAAGRGRETPGGKVG